MKGGKINKVTEFDREVKLPIIGVAMVRDTMSWVDGLPRISIFQENRIGPNIDPWGTPHEQREEEVMLLQKCKVYEVHHFRTVPEMPTQINNPSNRIAWSIVSEAVSQVKLKSIRM